MPVRTRMSSQYTCTKCQWFKFKSYLESETNRGPARRRQTSESESVPVQFFGPQQTPFNLVQDRRQLLGFGSSGPTCLLGPSEAPELQASSDSEGLNNLKSLQSPGPSRRCDFKFKPGRLRLRLDSEASSCTTA
jgi:hypothetical protein